MDRWAIFQLFAVMAVICWPISAWFILTGRGYRAQAQASQKWPTAQGTVLSSEVEQSRSLFSKEAFDYTYTPKVRYAYEVGGKRYEGDTIQFGYMGGKTSYNEEKVIQRYPVGGAATVHYDPVDPKVSVLETATSSGSGRYWAGWIFSTVPFLLVALLWWVASRG